MNILLDYFLKITQVEPTPAPNTAFLRQACVVAKKNGTGVDGVITECDSMTEVAALTDNTEAQQLFDAGLTKVYVLINDDLDIDAILEGAGGQDFYTLLISSDFSDAEVTAADFGTWPGVIGVQSVADAFLATQNAITKRSGWFTSAANDAKNMFWAFGKLLSNRLTWVNQQYIVMPFNDGVETLAQANNLFDDKISFVLNDAQYGNRLGLFAAGGKAITAPYIIRNLEIDMQGAALAYIVANQPAYTETQAALIQDELEKVIQNYVDRGLIDAGTVSITLGTNQFVADGQINVTEPSALWRIFAELRQTL